MQKAISCCFDSIQDAPERPRADQNKIWGFITCSGAGAGERGWRSSPARYVPAPRSIYRPDSASAKHAQGGTSATSRPKSLSVKNAPSCRDGIGVGAVSSLDALLTPMRNLPHYVMAGKKMQITVDGPICFWVGNNSSLFDNSSLK